MHPGSKSSSSSNACGFCSRYERSTTSAVALVLLLGATCLCCSNAKSSGGLQQQECARTCHEVNCDNVSVRYGKYCGVGHGGCPGEEPCDAADACCKQHDECVGEKHVLANDCHADFLVCLEQVMLSGSKGFSKTCPYSLVIPTMKNGIEMTMMFGEMFSGLNIQRNIPQPGTSVKNKKKKQRRQQQQKGAGTSASKRRSH